MISDQITLGSSAAYLLNGHNRPNLAEGGMVMARTPELLPNQIWDISGIELLIEGEDLSPLLHRPDALATPLLEVKVQKEVFPGLFANPFGTRVHNVAGFGDFERGKASNCFATEVNGIPTLVSRGSGECHWASDTYKLPTAIDIQAASWELATSRLVHEDQFEYGIKLFVWHDHNINREADGKFDLALEADANDARAYRFEEGEAAGRCHAFQLYFTANVTVDSAFYESHRMDFRAGQQPAMAGDTIGIPLLRSIRLLEAVESSHRFYSLNELIQRAGEYQIFAPQGKNFHRLLLTLDISAVLVGKEKTAGSGIDDREYLELTVAGDTFSRVQAKLVAIERFRIKP